jgi:hypothetical protein
MLGRSQSVVLSHVSNVVVMSKLATLYFALGWFTLLATISSVIESATVRVNLISSPAIFPR